MNKTYLILRNRLAMSCQFGHNSGLRNSLRQFSDKKDPPQEQQKKSVQTFQEECSLCDNIFKPCDKCPEAALRPESEKNLPGCMPFADNVPMPRPQPQFTEECVQPECLTDCERPKRKGPPRCPQRTTPPPENEKHETTGHSEDKKDAASKTEGCK